MIIDCNNCNKKFYIDQKLISKNGRLLQCGSCNHKWFFKNEITAKASEAPKINERLELFNVKKPHISELIDLPNKNEIESKISLFSEKIVEKLEISRAKIKEKNSFLNLTIIFIISFIALILLLDTFVNPLSKFFPDLEFFLYNLYETIKDITLFIRDLI